MISHTKHENYCCTTIINTAKVADGWKGAVQQWEQEFNRYFIMTYEIIKRQKIQYFNNFFDGLTDQPTDQYSNMSVVCPRLKNSDAATPK